ncbi:hypothetical protein A2671_00715 [Candidatus Kaiserbacteria bacterium RIFCSPHIGHO2_01_FULL_49_13]|uniref:Uncharacterized protein n=1 Tax=Candidatus Kaiserbacteria bacterium RIFCSPHIGHO2_01_FULL_49_13 TaxID=1798477 RepID=A0A1F6CE64_9BACT|nr:MAG: hypothetical protein A2671_00715 [Candidatus Kaiserbacteria bacterium RIFCSPHIGHO2_01_FULL_49_13]
MPADDYGTANIIGGFRRKIAHYYGDPVRRFLLLAAAILVVALPVYPNLLPFGVSYQVIVAVVLVVFAALTNPLRRWTLAWDAGLALAGLLMSEITAVNEYAASTWPLFLVRELLAFVFLFALYFSIKTLRAMTLHQTGKPIDR